VLRLVTNTPEEPVIEISDLAPHITEALAGHSVRPPDLGALAQRPLAEARADFERWRILRALHDSGGNQSQAAMDLGLSRAGLFKKMRRLGLTANH
jgi:transcriptional regulator of acetoin/glycerol metabolism